MGYENENIDTLKEILTDTIKMYRKRGLSLRNHVNPIMKKNGFKVEASWNATFSEIDQAKDGEITKDLLLRAINSLEENLTNRILFDDKFASITKLDEKFDEVLMFLKSLEFENISSVNKHEITLQDENDINIHYSSENLEIFILKKTRTYTVKEELGINALKLEHQNDDYEKLIAFTEVSIPCFDSIIMDSENKIAIFTVDLASIFQVDNLRGAIAHLKQFIRDGSNKSIFIPDKNLNLYDCIQELYIEDEGYVKELAFKTDDGVAHYENTKRGIKCIKDSDFHIAGSDAADVEAYKVKKAYDSTLQKQECFVYLASSWYILNGVAQDRRLGDFSISAFSTKDFNKIISKLLQWAKE